jgi:hypothetical protein
MMWGLGTGAGTTLHLSFTFYSSKTRRWRNKKTRSKKTTKEKKITRKKEKANEISKRGRIRKCRQRTKEKIMKKAKENK